jgi:AraC-like DNA-binding protein
MQTVRDTRGILNPREGAEHFTLTRHAPPPEVAARVERTWIVTWDLRGRPPYTSEVLPHPCVNLAFVSGAGRIWGVVLSKDRRHLSGKGLVVGTKFRPGGFLGFAPHVSQRALAGTSVTLEAAFGRDGGRLERRIAALGADAAEQAAAVDAFLAARMPPPDPGFELVAAVVGEIAAGTAGARVDAIAATHGVSVRTLQRLFERYVGVGPKWVLRRYRVHLAAERIAEGEDDLTRLALDLGYFDSAHFTHDFSSAVGQTPAAFARACRAAGEREAA